MKRITQDFSTINLDKRVCELEANKDLLFKMYVALIEIGTYYDSR
jgi:hypothetical protein